MHWLCSIGVKEISSLTGGGGVRSIDGRRFFTLTRISSKTVPVWWMFICTTNIIVWCTHQKYEVALSTSLGTLVPVLISARSKNEHIHTTAHTRRHKHTDAHNNAHDTNIAWHINSHIMLMHVHTNIHTNAPHEHRYMLNVHTHRHTLNMHKPSHSYPGQQKKARLKKVGYISHILPSVKQDRLAITAKQKSITISLTCLQPQL